MTAVHKNTIIKIYFFILPTGMHKKSIEAAEALKSSDETSDREDETRTENSDTSSSINQRKLQRHQLHCQYLRQNRRKHRIIVLHHPRLSHQSQCHHRCRIIRQIHQVNEHLKIYL